jgi:para-aminobenzoate synthetase component 1
MPQTAPHPRPVDLDLSPVEAAAASKHLPGFVFFDSAMDGPRAQISMLAAMPDAIVSGEEWDPLQEAVAMRSHEGGPDDGLPHGFAAGSVDYEGHLCFGLYSRALIFRHGEGRWYELGNLREHLSHPAPPERARPLHFKPELDQTRFCAMVRRAQDYIAAGDIYQVNLAHRFEAEWAGDPFQFYQSLRHYSPAPYGAFIDLGGRQILSSSPESFLEISGRAIRTRPIKGTRPRRPEPDDDERSAYDLITSQKEIAELVMITDLERNDLGAVCEFGSVHVRELLSLERYAQVFHLSSTVEGRLRPEIDAVAALRACFPGGSITGAPKRRAREIITELEAGPRGVFTGAIGWLGYNGESRFNIAIRTAVVEADRIHFHVGAGILADSSPEAEWQETLDKAQGILLAGHHLGREDADGLSFGL